MGAEERDEIAEAKRRAIRNKHALAQRLGRTVDEIEATYHPMKEGMAHFPGKQVKRNPDLAVDPETGWAFPELDDGGLGDQVDNIFNYLS